MTRSFPATDGVPTPLAEYSNVARISAPSELVLVSGQVALDADGNLCADASVEGQTRQTYANVERCLQAAGLGMRDVLKFTVFITDREHVQPFYRARRELFAELYPDGDYPGNSLLVVSGLVRPELLIEIEAVAACAS
jgi:enamine deaminase RidA (YjgF/YER057c/UK114 family)